PLGIALEARRRQRQLPHPPTLSTSRLHTSYIMIGRDGLLQRFLGARGHDAQNWVPITTNYLLQCWSGGYLPPRMGEVVGCLRNVDIKQQKPGGANAATPWPGVGSRARRSYERCAAAGSRQRWSLTRARALSAATHQFVQNVMRERNMKGVVFNL